MSYENEKLSFSKEKLYIVEIDLDTCSLTHGVAPCTAGGSGDARCYNTFDSCQDIPNYAKTTKTYRFCQSRSPQVIGLDAIPSLGSVSISPAKIDLSGGLGVRASVSLTFNDHPSSDIGIDNYVDDRSYIAFERGTYWTKLRARNPNYENRPLRVLSGYLVEGKFDPANFITRYYIIDKMNVTNGKATITAKDPLKLAGTKKAQAPRVTTGQIGTNITSSSTTVGLIPLGIGSLEYPSSGKLLIKSEVIAFTRVGNVLQLTRAQNNTVATAHDAGDTAQLCLEYASQQVDAIVRDLLVNYANIDPSFIPDSAWNAETNTFLSGLLSGIIVKPFDVFKLLKELAESMPHYLWWDEQAQSIQLTALKAPPANSGTIDMEGNIVADTFKTSDKPDLRKSTIFINFGQFDPTKKLDDTSNYSQTYARVDTDSIAKYGSNEIKVINSRWIGNLNKGAALQLGALIGRRFSDIPREISLSLEDKDSSLWVGQSVTVNHRDVTDFSGSPVDTVYQIMTAKESGSYKYTGLEFTYGDSLPEDEGGGAPGVDLVVLGGSVNDINLLDAYEGQFLPPTGTTQAKFIVDGGTIIGGDAALQSIETGSWPAGATITLQLNNTSFIVGRGGNAGNGVAAAGNGRTAILLNHDMTLINNGVIGGGGGGGAGFFDGTATYAGGGGAGQIAGIATISGGDGTLELGGDKVDSQGGNGGDLGQDGLDSAGAPTFFGGSAGSAIDTNGFVLTQSVAGDIRGAII